MRSGRLLLVSLVVAVAAAAQVSPALYSTLHWRSIGPFRGGRVAAVGGVPGDPRVYYMGLPGGGVWKTTDGGEVWRPVFDSTGVASVGALAVAPSAPNVVYVGTGDVANVGFSANRGNGVYKSTDGGRTWEHIGLDGTRHIGAIVVDPHDPNHVLVAALGPTFSSSPDRGVFLTPDGGRTWHKVLASATEPDAVGAIDLALDPGNSRVVYATLWRHYAPRGTTFPLMLQGGGGIFKSNDGGTTWTPITGHGLPTGTLSRVGVAVAPGGQRLFAIVDAHPQGGLYRSDDSGATWTRITQDARIAGSGYFGKVFVDPNHPDIVYVAQTSLYRSIDGGRTFHAFKGAPGGDDNHVLWIDPQDSLRMILGSDQGATISMDGGASWSSWYNQPTAQIYHLGVDSRFPNWVYGTQQDSGASGVSSRGDYGAITPFDWDAVAGYEFGYILPDPLHPDLIYCGSPSHGVMIINRRTHQTVDVSPNLDRDAHLRVPISAPMVFSPLDPHVLYYGSQFVLRTRNAGRSWEKISPDLSLLPGQKPPEEQAPPEAEKKTGKEPVKTAVPPARRYPALAINTLAASFRNAGVLWAGTTNGLVWVTRDGGHLWHRVTPAAAPPDSAISLIEASHFAAGTAYVAVDAHQLANRQPLILRTTDYGATWTTLSSGIPDGSFVRAIREDPVRRGLLYAGTENGVYVSWDDGAHWQSLRLDMPTTPVFDLLVHDDALIVATFGRAFWVLDDLTLLRQLHQEQALQPVTLFRPATAWRVRRDVNGDTPLPPEIPHGENPPAGAVLDYELQTVPAGPVTLAIYDAAGRLVRQFASTDVAPQEKEAPHVPRHWLAPFRPLPVQPGLNRFVWDLRYPTPPAQHFEAPISAIDGETPEDPRGPMALPGRYEVRLTVAGQVYRQPLTVAPDPRLHVPPAALAAQLKLEQNIMQLMTSDSTALEQINHVNKVLGTPPTPDPNAAFRHDLASILGTEEGKPSPLPPPPSLVLLNGELSGLLTTIESGDNAPIGSERAAFSDYRRDLRGLLARWARLQQAGLESATRKSEE